MSWALLITTIVLVALSAYSYDMLNRMYLDIKYIKQQVSQTA